MGYRQVYRYAAGKKDWLAQGWPTEGEQASVARVAAVVRRDVPTCRLAERVGEVRRRIEAAGWGLCVVVNDRRIVLGLLRDEALRADPDATAEQAMEIDPSTYRPHEPLAETAHHLADAGVRRVLVTTSDGELIGVLVRDDAERRAAGAGRVDGRAGGC